MLIEVQPDLHADDKLVTFQIWCFYLFLQECEDS